MLKDVEVEVAKHNDAQTHKGVIKEGTSEEIIMTTDALFLEEEKVVISYYFGQFVYKFISAFQKSEGGKQTFLVIDVKVEKNHRMSKRNIVDHDALIIIGSRLEHGAIRDLSEHGAKIETEYPISDKSKLELHYVNEENVSIHCKCEFVWDQKSSGGFLTGIKFI